jgi:hypothetical protein
MTADVEVVVCGHERRADALGLLARVWTADPDVNRAYWAWKYDRNPAAIGQSFYVALAGDRVVGVRGFNGARWEVGGSDLAVWAPCAGDTAIARDYESRGVFRAIMAQAEAGLRADGIGYTFNLSAGPAVFLRSLRAGWLPVGTYDVWQRPGRVRESDPAGADPFDTLDGAAIRVAGTEDCITVEARPRAEAMAALIRRAPPSRRIRRLRDAAYFAWRFENPLSRYRFLCYEGAGLEGYVVVRAGRYSGTDRVKIIDAEAASPAVLARLLDATVRLFGAWDLEIWTASLRPEVRVLLRDAGFAERAPPVPAPRHRRALLVKATDPRLPPDRWTLGPYPLLDPGSWDLRMMWSDGV